LGDASGSDVPQTWHEEKTSPNAQFDAVLRTRLEMVYHGTRGIAITMSSIISKSRLMVAGL
jgi:hypothetical protein